MVWAGAIIFLTVVLQPAIEAGGPDAGRFMQRLASQSRFQLVMAVAPLLAILSGLVLYGRVSAGFPIAWITSGTGLSLTIGGVAALLTAVVFAVFQRPVVARLQVLGGEVQRSRGTPTSAQAAEMQVLQRRMRGRVVGYPVIDRDCPGDVRRAVHLTLTSEGSQPRRP